jgi:hypothetical protein
MKAFIDNTARFFKEHPFIAWNIISLILLFIVPALTSITFIVSIIFFFVRLDQKQKERLEALKTQARDFFAGVSEQKAIPQIQTDVLLDKGEIAFRQDSVRLRETRAVRYSTGGSSGVRIAKGVYVGGYRGTSRSRQEWRNIDSGVLVITNKRLIFKGGQESRVFPLTKLISASAFVRNGGGIEISIDGRAKNMIFTVPNPYIWNGLIQVLKNVRDPLHIDVNLNVQVA